MKKHVPNLLVFGLIMWATLSVGNANEKGDQRDVLSLFEEVFESYAGIYRVYSSSLSQTPETCDGNGEITIDFSGTTIGVDFELSMFKDRNRSLLTG